MVMSMFVAPVVVAIQTGTPHDVLRAFVLTQVVIVFAMYLHSLTVAALRLKAENGVTTVVAIQLVRARIARLCGVNLLLIVESASLIERFGTHTLDWRTIILQMALILFVYAWGFADRRSFIPAPEDIRL